MHLNKLVSPVQLMNLQDHPIELVPAPGAGKIIVPRAMLPIYRYGTIPYVLTPDAYPEISYGTDVDKNTRLSMDILGQRFFVLEQVSGCLVQGFNVPFLDDTTPVNKSLSLVLLRNTSGSDNVNIQGGNGVFGIDIWYDVERAN